MQQLMPGLQPYDVYAVHVYSAQQLLHRFLCGMLLSVHKDAVANCPIARRRRRRRRRFLHPGVLQPDVVNKSHRMCHKWQSPEDMQAYVKMVNETVRTPS